MIFYKTLLATSGTPGIVSGFIRRLYQPRPTIVRR
jgi:hypothetical protein